MIPAILALAVGCCDQIQIGPSSFASKILSDSSVDNGVIETFQYMASKKIVMNRIFSCESLTQNQIQSVNSALSVAEYGLNFCTTSGTLLISDFVFFYKTTDEIKFSAYFKLRDVTSNVSYVNFYIDEQLEKSIAVSSECEVSEDIVINEDIFYKSSEIKCVEDDDGLSAGEIAGIVVGSVVGAGLLGYLFYRCWNRRSQGGAFQFDNNLF